MVLYYFFNQGTMDIFFPTHALKPSNNAPVYRLPLLNTFLTFHRLQSTQKKCKKDAWSAFSPQSFGEHRDTQWSLENYLELEKEVNAAGEGGGDNAFIVWFL